MQTTLVIIRGQPLQPGAVNVAGHHSRPYFQKTLGARPPMPDAAPVISATLSVSFIGNVEISYALASTNLWKT